MIILCAISVAVAIILRVIEEMFIDPNKPVPSLLRKVFFLRENKKKGKQSCHNNSFCIDIENNNIVKIIFHIVFNSDLQMIYVSNPKM